MTKTLCYYIPYSAKAVYLLNQASKRFGAIWKCNENEEITIVVKERYVARVEKLLATVV